MSLVANCSASTSRSVRPGGTARSRHSTIVDNTWSGSRTPESATNAVGRPLRPAVIAASVANRVLPTPPGPVTVTMRAPAASRSAMVASSEPRPTNADASASGDAERVRGVVISSAVKPSGTSAGVWSERRTLPPRLERVDSEPHGGPRQQRNWRCGGRAGRGDLGTVSSSGRVGISVLGPVAVRDASGRDVTPAGPLQRRLLALLVLRRGDVVSADAAIETLWPDATPRDAAAALQNHLFRLRRTLPDGVIESIGSGYRLDPSAVDVDVDRLEAVLGADEHDADAQAELAALLERWSGRALPELEDTSAGLAAAVRFDELPRSGTRGAGRTPPRRGRRRRARRRSHRVGRRRATAGAATRAADASARRGRTISGGAARLRRLPAPARWRVGHRPVASAGRPTRRAAGRVVGRAPEHHRQSAVVAVDDAARAPKGCSTTSTRSPCRAAPSRWWDLAGSARLACSSSSVIASSPSGRSVPSCSASSRRPPPTRSARSRPRRSGSTAGPACR